MKQLAIELKRLGHRPVIGFVAHGADYGRSPEFERQYLRELETTGVGFFFIGNSSRTFPPVGAWRVWRRCRSEGVQIYHSHLARGILLGMFVRIPRLYTHHSSVTRVPSWGYKLLNRLVDQYVGVSSWCAEQVERFTGRQVAVVRNGIDVSRFQARVRREFGPILECICIGRIVEAKNYQLLLESMALVPPRDRSRLRISIVGEGEPQAVAYLRREIHDRGLAGQVALLGNRPDVPGLLNRSDLFLMSSAWEGLPISLLEATASGLPFIATDVGGCREINELCGNGVIVPPKNPRAFANALVDLLDDGNRRTALSEAAVRNAGRLSIEKAAAEYLRLYGNSISSRPASPRVSKS